MEGDAFSKQDADDLSVVGVLKPLWNHRRLIVVSTLSVTALVVLVAAVHFWWQPLRWTVSLEFRPTFEGAEVGKYPNNLRFAPSDVTDPSVLDQVFDANKIQDFCARNEFRSAFSIRQRSVEMELIDFDYQARLADTRLTAVDRQRLQDEYRSRRGSAPIQYALTFIRPAECGMIPAAIAVKVLNDVLLRWAEDSELKRGVLKQRVKVLTPNALDVETIGRQSLFVRANLVWINLDRIIRNVNEVEQLPGAELVRFGEGHISLAEVRARLEDLQHSHLEVLMTSSDVGQDPDSIRWVEAALSTATNQQQILQDRARATLDALREYSGVSSQSNVGKGQPQRPPTGAEVQGLTTQLDAGFLDRIVGLSETNTKFRQELTRLMASAMLQAVESEAVVEHYKWLLAALKNRGFRSSREGDVASRLSEIVSEGKRLTREFDGLYDEWSRVAFRAAPALYQLERPAAIRVVRPFTLFTYATAIVLVFFLTLTFAVLSALVHTHLWPVIDANKSSIV